MVKYLDSYGRDFDILLYDNNNFLGYRKVYFYNGRYFVKYKGKFGEILDFIDFGIPLGSVDVGELYFK